MERTNKRSAFKRVSVEIGRQVRLLCPWARHFNKQVFSPTPQKVSPKTRTVSSLQKPWLPKA